MADPSVCRLSVVCRLPVTLVHPTQAVELFGIFFHHTIAQGLYFSGAKNRWWGTPLTEIVPGEPLHRGDLNARG